MFDPENGEMPLDFYSTIEPVYFVPTWAIPHNNGYNLEIFEGNNVVRTADRGEDTDDGDFREVLEYADYQDLLFMTEYLGSRIKLINIEIALPDRAVQHHVPSECLERRGQFPYELKRVDWAEYGRTVAKDLSLRIAQFAVRRNESDNLSDGQKTKITQLVGFI